MQPSEGFVELWRGVAYPWECDHIRADTALEYALEMINAATDEVCATSRVSAVLTELRTGRPLAWPAEVVQRSRGRLIKAAA